MLVKALLELRGNQVCPSAREPSVHLCLQADSCVSVSGSATLAALRKLEASATLNLKGVHVLPVNARCKCIWLPGGSK